MSMKKSNDTIDYKNKPSKYALKDILLNIFA